MIFEFEKLHEGFTRVPGELEESLKKGFKSIPSDYRDIPKISMEIHLHSGVFLRV